MTMNKGVATYTINFFPIIYHPDIKWSELDIYLLTSCDA